MRVRIHRGAHEIGGNCIEVEENGERIVLDLGRPLTAGWDDEVPLPLIEGLDPYEPSLRGVILSHPHLDHYGLAAQLDPEVPVYLGRDAARVLDAATFFSPVSRAPRVAGFLEDQIARTLGPFTITPHLNDHSAFDAYSLCIQAGEQTIFYTGDIRAHGRKAALFERLLRVAPPVDALLMEGTNVRAGAAPIASSEQSVEDDLVTTIAATGGMVAVCSSAQNIDRLVTVFRAARRSGRTLVVDLYTATVAQATQRSTIPQPGFDRLNVFVPQRQRVRVKEAEEFDRVKEISSIRVYPEQLTEQRDEFVFLGVSSSLDDLLKAGALQDGCVVWSLWSGYLTQPAGQKLVTKLTEANVPVVEHHTSGHAYVEDLQRLVNAFAPARVVPIHSEATDDFEKVFPRVEQHADGEWWDV